MKIVDRKTFLSLPAGTLYSKYQPCSFDNLEIKGLSLANDFVSLDVASAFSTDFDATDWMTPINFDFDLDTSYVLDLEQAPYRDALFDSHQLFAVWEKKDIEILISALQKSLETTT